MSKAFCPECDRGIEMGNNPHQGQMVTCQNCGAYLKVIGLSPIELDWADDDWDYDDEDYDDFDDDESDDYDFYDDDDE